MVTGFPALKNYAIVAKHPHASHLPHSRSEIAMPYRQPLWERAATIGCGVLILIFFLAILWRNEPWTDPNNVVIARALLSLGAAAIGAMIPGFLQVSWRGAGFVIRAAGALGLFVVTFFGTPKIIPPWNNSDMVICKPFINFGTVNCRLFADQSARQTAEEQLNKAPASQQKRTMAAWLIGYDEYKSQILQNPSQQITEKLISAPTLKAQAAILDEQFSAKESELANVAFTRALNADLQFDLHNAAMYYEKAFQLDQNNPNYAEHYAATLCDKNNFSEAAMIYTRTEAILRQDQSSTSDKESLACLLQNLGVVYELLGDLGKSVKKAQDALVIRQELAKTDPMQALHVGILLANIGANHFELGENDQAQHDYENAVAAVEASLPSESRDLFLAYILDRESVMLRNSDVPRADKLLERARNLCSKHANPLPDEIREWLDKCSRPYADSLRPLQRSGESNQAGILAVNLIKMHYLIHDRHPDEIRELARVYRDVGDLYLDMRNCAAAADAYDNVVNLIESLGLPDERDGSLLYTTLNNRGWNYYLCKMYKEAAPDFQRAGMLRPDNSTTFTNYAVNLAFLKSPKDGFRAYYETALLGQRAERGSFREVWRYLVERREGRMSPLPAPSGDKEADAALQFLIGTSLASKLLEGQSKKLLEGQSNEFDESSRHGLAFYAAQYFLLKGEIDQARPYFEFASTNNQGWAVEAEFARAELAAMNVANPMPAIK